MFKAIAIVGTLAVASQVLTVGTVLAVVALVQNIF